MTEGGRKMDHQKDRKKKPPEMTAKELNRAMDKFSIGMPFSSDNWHEYIKKWERSEQRKQKIIEKWQALKASLAAHKDRQ
jgi:hypothetical protein